MLPDMAASSPEVIIIGAGVIGCACAFELAAAGARVSVFDTRRVGQGASQASAGVLAPYIEGHEPGRCASSAAAASISTTTFVAGV